MNLNELSTKELRNYCLDNGLNMFELLTQLKESKPLKKPEPILKKVKVSHKKDYQEPVKVKKFKGSKNPKRIVLNNLKRIKDESNQSLENLTLAVKNDLTLAGVDLETNCTLQGFVSNVLYSQATKNKSKGKKLTYWDKMDSQVTSGELKSLLEVSFNQDDFNHIAGIIKPEYIKAHYTLNKEHELSKEKSAYEVEGIKCWPGSAKEIIREELRSILEKEIITPIQSQYIEDLNLLEKDKLAIKRKLNNLKSKEKKIKPSLEYHITGIKEPLITFKNDFLNNAIRWKGNLGEDITEKMDISYGKNNNITIKFKDSKTEKSFFTKFKTYSDRTHKDHGKNYTTALNINKVEDRESKSIKLNIESLSEEFKAQSMLIDQFKESSNKNINYLGLEGPNFSSYLHFFNFVNKQGITVNAVTPEYLHRSANIMKSIANSGVSDAFENVKIPEKNIDDLILMDFVDHPDVKLTFERNEGFFVEYKEDKIKLSEYYGLLEDIDKGTRKPTLRKFYNLSRDFVDIVEKRPDTKFDFVFLDYVGSISNKREKVLEALAERRLKDKAIVATTFNLTSWKNKQMNKDVIEDKISDCTQQIFEAENYNITSGIGSEAYKDSNEPMCFSYFVLEKKE
jgi:hypothetical protein